MANTPTSTLSIGPFLDSLQSISTRIFQLFPLLSHNHMSFPASEGSTYDNNFIACALRHGFAIGFDTGEVQVVLPPAQKKNQVLREVIVGLAVWNERLLVCGETTLVCMEIDSMVEEWRYSIPSGVWTSLASDHISFFLGEETGRVCEYRADPNEQSDPHFTYEKQEWNTPMKVFVRESVSWFLVRYRNPNSLLVWKRSSLCPLYIFSFDYEVLTPPHCALPGQTTSLPRFSSQCQMGDDYFVVMNADSPPITEKDIVVSFDGNEIIEIQTDIPQAEAVKYRKVMSNTLLFERDGHYLWVDAEEVAMGADRTMEDSGKETKERSSRRLALTGVEFTEAHISGDGMLLLLVCSDCLHLMSLKATMSSLTHLNACDYIGLDKSAHLRFGEIMPCDNRRVSLPVSAGLNISFSPDFDYMCVWTSSADSWTLYSTADFSKKRDLGRAQRCVFGDSGKAAVLFPDKILAVDLVSLTDTCTFEVRSSAKATHFFYRGTNLFTFEIGQAGQPPRVWDLVGKQTYSWSDFDSAKMEEIYEVPTEGQDDFIVSYANGLLRLHRWAVLGPTLLSEKKVSYSAVTPFAGGKYCAACSQSLTEVISLPSLDPVLAFPAAQQVIVDRFTTSFYVYTASQDCLALWDADLCLPIREFRLGLESRAIGRAKTGLKVEVCGKSTLRIAGKWQFPRDTFETMKTDSASITLIGAEGIEDYYGALMGLEELGEKNKKVELTSVLCGVVVAGLNVNVLHVLVGVDKLELVGTAFALGAKVMKSVYGTPFRVGIDKNGLAGDYIDVFLSEMIKLSANDPVAYVTALFQIEDDLCPILECDSSLRHSFLDTLLVPQPNMPISLSVPLSLPCIAFRPSAQHPALPPEERSQETAVEVLICPVRLCIDCKSDSGKQFISLLMNEEKDNRVLMKEFSMNLSEFMWQRVKWKIRGMAVVYWLLLAIILVRVYDHSDSVLVEWSLLGLNVILLLFELAQLIYSGWDYFRDGWNLADILRLCVTIPWIYIPQAADWLTLTVLVLSFIRGITTFEAFDHTRKLAKMILKVCIDTVFFIVIFIYCTFSFGILMAVAHGSTEEGLYASWTVAFRLNMGDFDAKRDNHVYWFVFFAACLVNVVWMLNLLVSILGSSYEKFKEEIEGEDVRAKLEIASEYSVLTLSIPSSFLSLFRVKPNLSDPREEHVTLYSLRTELEAMLTSVRERLEEVSEMRAESRRWARRQQAEMARVKAELGNHREEMAKMKAEMMEAIKAGK